jgi:hypothetical protein
LEFGMATNVNAPFGFRQYAGTGASPTYEQVELGNGGIDYNAAAIFYGDPVVRVGSGDGTITQAAGAAGGSTVTMAGIFVGCKYLSAAISRIVWSNYWPGGSPTTSANQSAISAWIINDPAAQFLVQSDSTGVTQAGVGSNFDFNIGTGTAANGLSGAFLLHTGVTTAAYPFRLNSLVLSPPGAAGTASGAYNLAVVAFNNVETKNSTAINT